MKIWKIKIAGLAALLLAFAPALEAQPEYTIYEFRGGDLTADLLGLPPAEEVPAEEGAETEFAEEEAEPTEMEETLEIAGEEEAAPAETDQATPPLPRELTARLKEAVEAFFGPGGRNLPSRYADLPAQLDAALREENPQPFQPDPFATVFAARVLGYYNFYQAAEESASRDVIRQDAMADLRDLQFESRRELREASAEARGVLMRLAEQGDGVEVEPPASEEAEETPPPAEEFIEPTLEAVDPATMPDYTTRGSVGDLPRGDALVQAILGSQMLKQALQTPLGGEGWEVIREPRALDAVGASAYREGAILAIDSQMRLKQVSPELTGNIIAAMEEKFEEARRAAGGTADPAAVRRAGLLLLLRDELDRDEPRAQTIQLLLDRLAASAAPAAAEARQPEPQT